MPAAIAVMALAVTAAAPSLAVGPGSREPAIRREGATPAAPVGAGESTVTLIVADASSPAARAAAAAVTALASAPVRSDAEAAARRSLLARTRLSRVERAAVGSRVRTFAARHGLRLLDEGTAYLTVAGDVDDLAVAFGATLRSVATPASGVLRVAAAALAVPAELRSVIRGAHGLDDRPAMRGHAIPGGYEGRHLRPAYRVPSTSRLGAGTTIGLFQPSGWQASDLTTYASAAGIPLAAGQITEVSVDGADPTQVGPNDNAFEVALDVEGALAIAPKARQRLYFTKNSFSASLAGYARMAQDAEAGLLTVASTSWGICEPEISESTMNEMAIQLRRIVAAGATLTASSGDAGAYDCSEPAHPDARVSVDFPASLPEALAVGGTTLPKLANGNANPSAEKAWGVNAGSFPAYQGDGAGGGSSARFARPAYQAGISIAGTTRLVPDLAALADAATGPGVYVQSEGGWLLGGGTSYSSPLVAGLIANAASDANRTSGPGDIHAAIYANPSAFRDITTGANNLYPATAGYDRVTGLGAPLMDVLAPRIGLSPAAASPSPSPTTASPSPAPSSTSAPQAPTLVAQTTAIAGVLITVSGTAAPGAEVELWGVTAPNGTITRVNTPTVTADSNGNWSKVIRPLRNVNLQARVGAAVSSTRFIAVSTAVRQSVSPLAACVVQVSGAVFEPKPGATVFIRAVNVAGSTVSLGTGFVEGDGRFLLRKPYACDQRLAVYTVISGDAVNRPGGTTTQTITTRR